MDDQSYSQKNANNNNNGQGNRHNNSNNQNNKKRKMKKKKKRNNKRGGGGGGGGRGGYGKRYNNNDPESNSGSNQNRKRRNNNRRRRGGYRGGGNVHGKNEEYYKDSGKNSTQNYQNSNQDQGDYNSKVNSSIHDPISGTQTPRSFNSNYAKSNKKQSYNKKSYDRRKYDEQDGQYKPKSQIKDRDFRKDRGENNEYYTKKGSNRKQNKNKSYGRRKPGKFKKQHNMEEERPSGNFDTRKSSRFNNEYETKKTIPITTNLPSSMTYDQGSNIFPETPINYNQSANFNNFQKMIPPPNQTPPTQSLTNSRAPNPIPHNPEIIPQNHNINLPKSQYPPQVQGVQQIPINKGMMPENFQIDERRRSHQYQNHPPNRNQNHPRGGHNHSSQHHNNNFGFQNNNPRYQNNNNGNGNSNGYSNHNKSGYQKRWNNNGYNNKDKYRQKNYNNFENLHPGCNIATRHTKRVLWSINKNFFHSKKADEFEPFYSYEEAKELIVQEKAFRGKISFREKLPTLGIVQSEDFVKKVYANVKNTNRTVEGCEVIFMPISQGWQKYLYVNQNEENLDIEKQEQTEMESEIKICMCSDFRFHARHKYMNDEDMRLEKSKVKVKVIYIEKNPLLKRNIIVKVRRLNNSGDMVGQYAYDERYPQFSADPSTLALTHNNKQDTSRYYLAKYLGWNVNERYPKITLLEPLGKAGVILTECDSLMKQFDIPAEKYHKNFTEDLLRTYKVDEFNNFIITEEMSERRTDLTDKLIFTVGMSYDKDLDDALSIEDVGKGVYKVGVHISDVSFFVKQNTDLDKEAQRRANSYFLPHTIYSMLPQILTENFCKLEAGKDKLAFSIFFKLNSNGELMGEHPELCKSVINSKCTLPYKLVQDIIEGKIKTKEEYPSKQFRISDFEFNDVKEAILMMNKVASARKKKRLKKGSIFFANKKKIRFRILDDEKQTPTSWEFETVKEANFMVQEFMLLANVLTAKILLQNYPNLSLLRKNSAPSKFKISKTQEILEKYGNYKIKLSNSKSLAKAIYEIKNNKNLNPMIKDYLNYAIMETLKPSEYIVSDQSNKATHYHHFALNFDLYTHFTSPVRRYPDLIVHRLLTSLIENNPVDEKTTKVSLLNICRKSNKNKTNGNLVKAKAEEIFILMILRKNAIITTAFVVDIYQGKLKLYLREFKKEKIVYLNYQSYYMEFIDENTVLVKENTRNDRRKHRHKHDSRDNAVLKSKSIKVSSII